MRKKSNNDLTVGSPYKSIVNFAIPILIGSLLQQAYNITDSAIVGRFIGIEALAGVGSTGSLNFLVIGFVIGTCTGFGIPISQSYGSNNIADLKKYFAHAIYLAAFISIVLTITVLIFLRPILVLMNTTDEMMPYAYTYISTIFMGIAGMYLYNLLAAVLRAIGNSKTPLFFLICSAGVNLILDLIFVIGLQIGVLGTALATVISQTASGIACIILINKKVHLLQTTKKDWIFDFAYIKKLFSLGVPMGLQFSITAIGSVILQSAVNSLGTIYAASISAGSKISGFAIKPLETLGLAMATFAGQNLGAGKLDRISKGLKQSVLIGFAYSVVTFIVIFFTGEYLALILVSADEVDAIANIQLFLLFNMAALPINTLLHIFRNTIQGLGYSAVAMFAGVMELFARVFVAFGLIGLLGYTGSVLANPVAWGSAVIFLVPTYFIIMKKLRKKNTVATIGHP